MRLAIGLLAAVALVGGGLAGAQATGGLGHNDRHARKLETEVVGLLNSGSQYVARRYFECRVRRAAGVPRLVRPIVRYWPRSRSCGARRRARGRPAMCSRIIS